MGEAHVGVRPDWETYASSLGVATLVGSALLGVDAAFPRLLPRPGGIGFWETVSTLANPVLIPGYAVAVGVVVGLVAAVHTGVSRATTRVSVALGSLGATLLVQHVAQHWGLAVSDQPSWRFPLGVGLGAGLSIVVATPVARLASSAKRYLPEGIGAFYALLWAPLLVTFSVAAVYLVATALVAVLYAVGIALGLVACWFALKFTLRILFSPGMPNYEPPRADPSEWERGRQRELEESREAEEAQAAGKREQDAEEERLLAVRQGRAESNEFDANGKWLGYTDHKGRHFDTNKRYVGRTDEAGYHYDEKDRYVGRTNEQGHSYDKSKNYTGWTNDEGQHFDKNDRYEGGHE